MARRGQLIAGLLVCLVASGCSPSGEVAPIGQSPGSAESYEMGSELLRELSTIPYVPAEGVTGPNGTSFFVHDRTGVITQFPCTSCHTKIPQSGSGAIRTRAMHQDIQIKHAGEAVMNCSTCHHSSSPDDLSMLGGQKVAMQSVHQQCAQCHSDQATDWAGGAHGKRLVGWKGPRVINTCTDCHNPHQPAIPERQPAAGPRLSHER